MKIPPRRTAAALALVLVAAVVGGAVGAGTTSSFPDVSPTHPFHDEIERFAEAGITGGYADGTYRPGAPVTRQAMAAFLVRGLGSVSTDYANGAGPFGSASGAPALNDQPLTLPWSSDRTQRVIVRGIVDWATEASRATVCPTPGPGCGFQLSIAEGGATRATSNVRISGDWDGGTALVEAVYEVQGTNSFHPVLRIDPAPGVSAASLYVLQSALTVQTVPFGLEPGLPA